MLRVASVPITDPKPSGVRPIPPERKSSVGDRDGVSVVIPAFNEEVSVLESVTELREMFAEACQEAEIIVVDDGSRVGTAREAKAAGARVLQHRSNRG